MQTSTPTITPTCNPCLLTTDQNPSWEIGEPDLSTCVTQTLSATSLLHPEGVFQAGNDLIVGDTENNRVMVYSPIPSSNQPAATIVIGQSSFASNNSNQGGAVDANTLANPEGVWSNGTTLIVADRANNRVLIYWNVNNLPVTNGSANVVIGQINMTNNGVNQGGTEGPNTLNDPWGVFYDGQRLFIADAYNNRVLIYNSLPVTNNAPANEVIGQPDFTSSDSGTSGQTLSDPYGICVYNGSLFVTDMYNNRVLIYNNAGLGIDSLPPNSAGVTADGVVGQSSFTTNSLNTSANGLAMPYAVSANNCQLFIADNVNERVLVYNNIPTGTTNPPADVVLGEPNMTTIGQSPCLINSISPLALQAIGGVLYVASTESIRTFACATGTGTSNSVLGVSEVISKPSSTLTPTVTSTPTIGTISIVTAPNISKNGEPVHFNISLPTAAQVHLQLFNLMGEKIYKADFQGVQGLNTLNWPVHNQSGQMVASGIYIYVLNTNSHKFTGKIAVIH